MATTTISSIHAHSKIFYSLTHFTERALRVENTAAKVFFVVFAIFFDATFGLGFLCAPISLFYHMITKLFGPRPSPNTPGAAPSAPAAPPKSAATGTAPSAPEAPSKQPATGTASASAVSTMTSRQGIRRTPSTSAPPQSTLDSLVDSLVLNISNQQLRSATTNSSPASQPATETAHSAAGEGTTTPPLRRHRSQPSGGPLSPYCFPPSSKKAVSTIAAMEAVAAVALQNSSSSKK